jgi:hypothetical protein
MFGKDDDSRPRGTNVKNETLLVNSNMKHHDVKFYFEKNA